MDYKQKFNEVLNFLETYYGEVFDLDSEGSHFFLSLSKDIFDNIEAVGISQVIPYSPKKIKEILEEGEQVSQFTDTFEIVPQKEFEANAKFYRKMSEKKRLEVHNFGNLFLRYSENIDNVVEIACGVGHLSNYLATVIPPQIEISGIDIQPTYVDSASKKSTAFNLRTRFTCKDAFQDISNLMEGKHNAIVTLHGCNYLSHRGLSMNNAELLMVSPCCYNRLLPKDYFMSDFANEKMKNSGINVDTNLGEIAVLGPNSLSFGKQIKKMDKVKKQFQESNFKVTELDKKLLEYRGLYHLDINPENLENITNQLHVSRRRHALFKKLFTRPIEALFSSDKAVYLEGSGYEAHVHLYMPFSISPRNHLIVGRK